MERDWWPEGIFGGHRGRALVPIQTEILDRRLDTAERSSKAEPPSPPNCVAPRRGGRGSCPKEPPQPLIDSRPMRSGFAQHGRRERKDPHAATATRARISAQENFEIPLPQSGTYNGGTHQSTPIEPFGGSKSQTSGVSDVSLILSQKNFIRFTQDWSTGRRVRSSHRVSWGRYVQPRHLAP